jgi:diacylglycerol kinase family enzyme
MRFRVLINGGAGSVDDEGALRDDIAAAFRAAGATAEVEVVDPADIDETIRRWWAVEDRPTAIVVAGGDGTVNGAAAVAAGTDIVLSVLPLGTFNHFAKDLGIPDDLTEAAHAIVDGTERRVDVAEVNGEVFVNNSALGVYPAMVATRDRIRDATGWGKIRAVPVASLRVLRDLPTHRFDLVADGWERRRVRTPFVFVGNGDYDNGRGGAAERTGLDDGRLGVVVARTTTRFGLLRSAVRAIVRGVDAADDLDRTQVPSLTIEGRARRLLVARDGEIGRLDLPLRYRCRPGALIVRAPAVGDDERDETDDAASDR